MTIIKAKYHIIYKTTCDITKRFYYGMHSTNNLKDGYLGSGSELSRSLKKYGRENHSIETLEFLEDRKSLKKREAEILTETILHDPMCMNLAKGGGGSDYTIGLVTVKDKYNNYLCVNKDDPRYLSGELVFNLTGFVNVKDKDGNIHFICKDDPRYLSGELKWFLIDTVVVKDKDGNNMNVHKNDYRYLSGELVGCSSGFVNVKDKDDKKHQVSKTDPRYLSGELKFIWSDKNHKEESKLKIGEANSKHQKGKRNSQYGTIWVTDGLNNKRIKKNDDIPSGWKKGRHISESQKEKLSIANKGKGTGKNNSQYGKMWITNGTINKSIKKTDDIPNGWKRGMVNNRK